MADEYVRALGRSYPIRFPVGSVSIARRVPQARAAFDFALALIVALATAYEDFLDNDAERFGLEPRGESRLPPSPNMSSLSVGRNRSVQENRQGNPERRRMARDLTAFRRSKCRDRPRRFSLKRYAYEKLRAAF